MEMKNKLYKHHKSRFHFLVKDLSIGTASVFGFLAIVSLPTYISINNQLKMAALASEVNDAENVASEVDKNSKIEEFDSLTSPIEFISLPEKIG